MDVLRVQAATHPDATAFTFLLDGEQQTVSVSYQGLDRRARAIAAQLQHYKAQGRFVLILCRPSLDFIAAFMGCLYAGVIAIPTPLPGRFQSIYRAVGILQDTQAPFVLTTQDLLPKLSAQLAQALSPPPPHWIAINSLDLTLAETWVCPSIAPDDLALLQYTSGSTGAPKGVMISHGNLIHNARLLAIACTHDDAALNVSWLPMYHDMGLMGNVLQPLYLGKPSVLMKPIAFIQKPVRWLQAITRYRATHSGGPSFAYDLLSRYVTPAQKATLDLSRWEVAFCGAEPIRASTLERFAETFSPCGFRREAFYPCYGMAEATLFITGSSKATLPTLLTVDAAALDQGQGTPTQNPLGRHRTVVGCGQPWLDTRLEIVNPTTLARCRPGEIGEIWVQGSSIGLGYWQQPTQTDQTFRAFLADTGEGPFLRTGDLGFWHEGELFVTGRLKEVMKFWGLNRYPQHLEQTVESSYPLFQPNRGAAFAVPVEGEDRLVVVYEVVRSARQNVPLNAVVESVRWHLARRHFLDLYALVLLNPGQLPVTSSGKVQRQACRTAFLNGGFNPLAEWRSPPNTTSDLPALIKRYLNPMVHLRRYALVFQAQLLQRGQDKDGVPPRK